MQLRRREKEDRRSWVAGSLLGPRTPMHQSAPVRWSRDATASAYVGWDSQKIRKDCTSGKGRTGFRLSNALLSERFHHRQNNDRDHQNRRDFVDDPIKSLAMSVSILRRSRRRRRRRGESARIRSLRMQKGRREMTAPAFAFSRIEFVSSAFRELR